MLHKEPSFCVYADVDGFIENKKEDLGIKTAEGMDGFEFTFAKRSMGLIVEDDETDKLSGYKNLAIEEKNIKDYEQMEPPSPKMHLATGLGIDGMGDIGLKPPRFDESGEVEEYYKARVSEYPCNPLFLSNHAWLLQSKGDLTGAEDYYFHAMVEDPKDGEILMQYAKLVWELHHDQDRALSYFESAARVAPGDCNVLAAYASFLWDIDQDEYEDRDHGGLILSKGDLRGAEEYYARAMLADPGDGKVSTQYAELVWEVHHDLDKASCYFERAVQAAPADSHILAAYAKFLWDAED